MSKKTKNQEQEEIIAQVAQQLSESDRLEFEELHRIALSYSFIAGQIKGNTALIPEGQKVAEQYEAIARLMENSKNQWMGQKLASMGYPNTVKVSIDIKTGNITPINES
jgi:hypothetical protein